MTEADPVNLLPSYRLVFPDLAIDPLAGWFSQNSHDVENK
jgi:hypothetical protein